MKRYVSVSHSAAGATSVKVTLVDGELSAAWTEKSYLGSVAKATKTADLHAHQALEAIKVGLEPNIEAAS